MTLEMSSNKAKRNICGVLSLNIDVAYTCFSATMQIA